jgi:hypothetical protein
LKALLVFILQKGQCVASGALMKLAEFIGMQQKTRLEKGSEFIKCCSLEITENRSVFKIRNLPSSAHQHCCLMACDFVQSGRMLPSFQKNIPPPSSVLTTKLHSVTSQKTVFSRQWFCMLLFKALCNMFQDARYNYTERVHLWATYNSRNIQRLFPKRH